MPTKKKKTTKKTTTTKTHKKTACCTKCKKGTSLSSRDRMHVYIVTGLSITAGILLCTDAVIMIMA